MSTINCHYRLPRDFSNLPYLFIDKDDIEEDERRFQNKKKAKNKKVDIYCVNLQQLVYRGARTIFSGEAEQAPGRAWIEAIPE